MDQVQNRLALLDILDAQARFGAFLAKRADEWTGVSRTDVQTLRTHDGSCVIIESPCNATNGFNTLRNLFLLLHVLGKTAQEWAVEIDQ